MAETFDNDLRNELERHNEYTCPNCGYVGEYYEFEFYICPNCNNDCSENQNNEYNPDEK
jgi:lipopolysaccharide biosynthesis regulator YciM